MVLDSRRLGLLGITLYTGLPHTGLREGLLRIVS